MVFKIYLKRCSKCVFRLAIDRPVDQKASSVDRGAHMHEPTERSTDWHNHTFGWRSVDRQRVVTLYFWVQSTGRSTGNPNGDKIDHDSRLTGQFWP